MSTPNEVKELVDKLKKKTKLKPYEVRFLEIYDKKICDEKLAKELQLIGRDKYIERNHKTDIKEASKKLLFNAKEGNKALTGNWGQAPPAPPPFPDDCVIM